MQSSTLQCNVVRRLHPFAENHQSSIPKARLALTETGSAVKMQLARASRRDLGASDASQHARADAVSRRCRPSERGLRFPITRCMRHSRLKRGFYWVSITQNQQHIRCLQPSVSSIRRLFTGFESPCRLPPGVDARALTHLRVFDFHPGSMRARSHISASSARCRSTRKKAAAAASRSSTYATLECYRSAWRTQRLHLPMQ